MGLSFVQSVNNLTKQSVFTHIARIDYDDSWHPNHLSNLARAFEHTPDAFFAYSRAAGFFSGGFPSVQSFPDPSSHVVPNTNFYLYPPVPCGVIHSAVSWGANHSLSSGMCFRGKDQIISRRDSFTTGCINNTAMVYPGDADLWQRVAAAMKHGLGKSIFIDEIDVTYTCEEAKKIKNREIEAAYLGRFHDTDFP
jgi:hypothetical protein